MNEEADLNLYYERRDCSKEGEFSTLFNVFNRSSILFSANSAEELGERLFDYLMTEERNSFDRVNLHRASLENPAYLHVDILNNFCLVWNGSGDGDDLFRIRSGLLPKLNSMDDHNKTKATGTP